VTSTPTTPVTAPRDFGFQPGHWQVQHRRLRAPLGGLDPDESSSWVETSGAASARLLMAGQVSVDEIELGNGETGMSLRLRSPETDEWTIYWVNSRDGALQAPVAGYWQDGRFEGVGPDHYAGRPILARYAWSDITATAARWEQAFSTDNGETWETNWVMLWTRDDVPAEA
jgi:hypothetical protein